jgi:WD40 repeat protein
MKIWNPINGTFKRTLNGHAEYVFALTLLQNGDLASGSANRTMEIWNPINGTFKRTLNGHTDYVLY